MLPALTSLIALQDVASRADDARRRMAEAPTRIQALDAQLASATQAVESAKAALAENQAARRDLEKEAAVAQQRVSKYKDQLMEAKDNKQFHALQHEITTFGEEVSRVEGLIIERMVEGDELTATVKAAEAALATSRKAVQTQRAAIETETAALTASLEGLTAERARISTGLTASELSTFETRFKAGKGVAIARVVDGLCEACRIRVRPHLYNQIRAGDQIIQCESCQRMLYFIPPAKVDGDAPAVSAPGAEPA